MAGAGHALLSPLYASHDRREQPHGEYEDGAACPETVEASPESEVMPLPWVARSTVDVLQREIARLSMSVNSRHADYIALLDKYTALAAQKTPEKAVIPDRTRDEVIDAILQKSGTNGQLRQHLSAWAREQRRQHIPDDEIVQHILIWDSSDEAGIPE